MNNTISPEIPTSNMDDYIVVDNPESYSDKIIATNKPCSVPEQRATFSDIPEHHFDQAIAADDVCPAPERPAILADTSSSHPDEITATNSLCSASKQQTTLPNIPDKAIAAGVDEQPRGITWSDIKSASIWPQVLLTLLHIPTLLHSQDHISALNLFQPWVVSEYICTLGTVVLLCGILIHVDGSDKAALGMYQIGLPLLWQQLVAFHLESIELSSWWWREMVVWVLVVAGGHLLLLATRVYAGDYAWPQASHEEQRKALEAAHVRDPEKNHGQYPGGEWVTKEEVTDEFIAEVFKRPSSGFWAVLYFFRTSDVIGPCLMTFATFCYRLMAEFPWQGNQFLAYILYFVVLVWLWVMLEAATVLRELPEGLPKWWLDRMQRQSMLGGENTSAWRMKTVVYRSADRVVHYPVDQ